MMPELDGIEVCRRARQTEGLESLYIILVTSRDSEEDIVAGLDAEQPPACSSSSRSSKERKLGLNHWGEKGCLGIPFDRFWMAF